MELFNCLLNLPSVYYCGIAASIGCLSYYYFFLKKPSSELVVKDWTLDIIYFFAAPTKQSYVSCLSPYAVKLETFLRKSGLKYESVPTFRKSPKGNYPFIELNGKAYSDTNLIIRFLSNKFAVADLDSHLSVEERALSVSFYWMFEEVLTRCCIYLLMEKFTETLKTVEFSFFNKRFNFIAVPILSRMIRRRNMTKLFYQGLGRFTHDELMGVMKEVLESASNQLSNQPFLFGTDMSRSDVLLFSLVFYIFSMPTLKPISKLIDHQYPNLGDFARRNQKILWPEYPIAEKNL